MKFYETIFKKMLRFQIIDQKLNSKLFYYPWQHACSKFNFLQKRFLAQVFIKMHRFQLFHQKLNSKGFFPPLVLAHLFKIHFPTKKFLAKIFIKMNRFHLIYRKLNLKVFFWPLVVTRLFKTHKNAYISNYRPKTEFEKFFRTLGGARFVSYSISYKKVLSENYHKNALISTYWPET